MKTGTRTSLLSILGLALAAAGCANQKPHARPASTAAKPAAAATAAESPRPAATEAAKPAAAAGESPALSTNTADRVGYAIGLSIGGNLKRANFDVNLDQVMQGIKDVMGGVEPKMTEQQARETIMGYEQQRQREVAQENLKAGAAFLEANKKKEGVKVLPVTLADGSTAELQYKVITEGTGEIPKSNDTVSVNYQGTLIDGKEFDSSARHGGRPAKFVVDRVIRGWTEALEMMPVGSKWELYIPASLAYGDRPSPTIPAGSTLIFQVELLDIEKPKPLTSDIIRVPSAEEMKAGAKIEVIKAEDAEKMAAAQTNQVKTNSPGGSKP